jgi:hypothetical protein
MEFWVWIVIMVVVAVVKGLGKLKEAGESGDDEPADAPPVIVKPKRPPQRARPRPAMVPPGSALDRGPEPVRRQITTAELREARGMPTPPPVAAPPKAKRVWNVDEKKLREFIEQVTGQQLPRAPEPVAAPPPLPAATATAPTVAEPVAEAPPPPATSHAPAKPTRAQLWAEALRDRANTRNIIVAAEILGKPVSLR